MRESIKYISSAGNEYELNMDGTLHKKLPYFSWAWDVEGTKLQYGTRVSGFSKKAVSYKANLLFYDRSRTQRDRIVNALHDDYERDVRNMTPGRVVIGNYYIDCYIKSVDTRDAGGVTTDIIEIYCPYPFWVQESYISLPTSQETASEFLDYPYDYPYDYTAPVLGHRTVKSDFPFASEFKMVIFGVAVNPRITINGYQYILYTTIPSGSYAVIDSRNKSIMMYSNGEKTDLFNFRNKTLSVFEKIPAGNLDITWNASFGVDITIYRERSEPRKEVAE